MPKAGKKLKRRCYSVKRVDDVHAAETGTVYLNLKCCEGWMTLAVSAADFSYIAGFSARQRRRQAIDAGSKASHLRAVD